MIEDIDKAGEIARDKKAMYVLSVNPITLSILKSPGEVGADVAVGDTQVLGNELWWTIRGIFGNKIRINKKNARKSSGSNSR